MPWTPVDIMTVLYIVVAVMLIVVLYHVLFIVVDLRRMTRRADRVTESVESVMLKPLSIADQGFEWVIAYLKSEKHKRHAKHHAHQVAHGHHEKK
jgi:cell shape-determining protein MreC